MPAEMEYLPVVQGKHLACPRCGVIVMLRIDEYGCCKQRGGCEHIGVIEQYAGEMRVGFFALA